MLLQWHPLILPLLVSAFVAAIIAVYAFEYASRARERTALYAFVATMVCGALWSFGYALQLAATSLQQKLVWDSLQLLTAMVLSVAWFVFAVGYTDRGRLLTRRRLALLGTVPVATVLLLVTDPWHELLYAGTGTVPETLTILGTTFGPYRILELTRGPVFYAFAAYSYVLFLAGFFMFVQLVASARWSLYRRQALLLLGSGSLLPIGTLLYLLTDTRIDPGPMLVSVMGVGFALALFRYRLFEVEPAARKVAIEHMRDGYLLVDRDGTVVDHNSAAGDLLEATELVGKRLSEVIPAAAAIVDEAGPTETAFERPDGRYFEAHLSPIQEGQTGSRVLLLRDVTRRRERKTELERSRELLDSTQKLAAVGGWELEAGTERVRVTDQLSEILDVTGGASSPTREALLETIHPADRQQLRSLVETCFESADPFTVTVRLSTAGEPRWTRITGYPVVEEDGRVSRIRGATQDITERKRRERSLRARTRELERQNERLDEFASIVSHDLRNPLNVATGSLDLAEERGEQRQFRKVREAHERMADIIDDVLTMARKGTAIEETQQVRIDEVAEAAWQSVEADAAALSVPASQTVAADRSRLVQAFENLLRNATEHGPNDVTITVGDLENGFYVADDGPGIPPEHRDSVLDHGYTTSDTGTGLGLSIVSNVVDAHGWDIDVAARESGDEATPTDSAGDGSDTAGARFEIRFGDAGETGDQSG
jgi:PAS domain S-box-containing protein